MNKKTKKLKQIIYNLESIEDVDDSEVSLPKKRVEYEECINRALEELREAKKNY